MFVMISGCSGGGKSTLLSELARRGYAAVAEPGRRIIAEARESDGRTLPWVDRMAFANRAMEMSAADYRRARGLTFFDRGIVDAAVALVAAGGRYPRAAIERYRYDRLFFAPPWPDIYENDEDRRHTLETALRDYERVLRAYRAAGYHPIVLPCVSVSARADYVLDTLSAPSVGPGA